MLQSPAGIFSLLAIGAIEWLKTYFLAFCLSFCIVINLPDDIIYIHIYIRTLLDISCSCSNVYENNGHNDYFVQPDPSLKRTCGGENSSSEISL